MRIVIKDTKNENITTKFKIAEGGQAQVDVSNKSDTSLRMRGKNSFARKFVSVRSSYQEEKTFTTI